MIITEESDNAGWTSVVARIQPTKAYIIYEKHGAGPVREKVMIEGYLVEKHMEAKP